MLVDLYTQLDKDINPNVDISTRSNHKTDEMKHEWDLSFRPFPSSICGISKKRSTNLCSGSIVASRKCMCGLNLMVGKSDTGRAFLKCSKSFCKYFRWAEHVLDPPLYSLAHTRVEWKELSSPVYSLLPHDGSTSLHECIVQGHLGDCWFLSALGVLCENSHLFNHVVLPDKGATCEFRFCVSGIWEVVSVDKYVPVYLAGNTKGVESFARPYKNVSFGPLIEKAYAKMYGSYASLHGGLISEALFDLTGCPVETISITSNDAIDDLWVRLVSFQDNKFLIGAATESDDNGLVGMHAYSVIDLIELYNVQVGRQSRITDFLNPQSKLVTQTTRSVRLVQLRNPWGKKEWQGDWSGQSDKWTQKILNEIPNFNARNQKGKFWMEFDEFTKKFSEIEVAKTHANWVSRELRDVAVISFATLLGSKLIPTYKIYATSNQWTYISVIQPSVRGRTSAKYAPVHIILLTSQGNILYAGTLGEMERITTLETMLEKGIEYDMILFSSTDLKSCIRIFSSQAITCTSSTRAGIPNSMFERIFTEKLPLQQVVDISPTCYMQIHSNKSLAAFILTSSAHNPVEINVVINTEGSRLTCFGKWRAILSDPATTILGIIVGQPISEYSFEINAKAIVNVDENDESCTVKHEIVNID